MSLNTIKTREFGTLPTGEKVIEYTLTNPNGVSVKFISRGCTLIDVQTPDRHGKLQSVLLGFGDSLETWLKNGNNFSSIVGRYANRIANARFKIDDKEYQLAANNGPNHLHGGPTGFYMRNFDEVSRSSDDDSSSVTLKYVSADGEEGYPGELTVLFTITLTSSNVLTMEFKATTNKKTIVNICNHGYWNLSGDYTAPVTTQRLQLNAEKITPIDENMIPTGELANVSDPQHSHHDFTTEKLIGEHIGAFANVDKPANGGYDHNYVLTGQSDKTHPHVPSECVYAATLRDPASGRTMDVYATAPGLQIYTGNFLTGDMMGKEGKMYEKHAGVCMETQTFPNSPNEPSFPSPLLDVGQEYRHVVSHVFHIDPTATQ